jgi:putative addiction module component (TIGR02574 family)
MGKVDLGAFLELSVGDRVELVQALWDSIAEQPDPYPLSERECRLVDERLAAYRDAPNAASVWSEVKARILGPQ